MGGIGGRVRRAAALPPCLLAGALGLVLVQESCGYRALWPDDRLNLAEAAAARDVPRIEQLLRDGADLHARYAVRPGLADARPGVFTPLEAAVAANDVDVARVLLRRGALDAEALVAIACGGATGDMKRLVLEAHPHADHVECEPGPQARADPAGTPE